MKDFAEFASEKDRRLIGTKERVSDLFDIPIVVRAYRIIASRAVKGKDCAQIQYNKVDDPALHVTFTNSEVIIRQLKEYEKEMPFTAKIIKDGAAYTFISARDNVQEES